MLPSGLHSVLNLRSSGSHCVFQAEYSIFDSWIILVSGLVLCMFMPGKNSSATFHDRLKAVKLNCMPYFLDYRMKRPS